MRKNKIYIIVASCVFVIGLILLLVSGILNGWDFSKWIHDKKTITGIVVVSVIWIVTGILYLKKKVSEL